MSAAAAAEKARWSAPARSRPSRGRRTVLPMLAGIPHICDALEPGSKEVMVFERV